MLALMLSMKLLRGCFERTLFLALLMLYREL